MPGYIVALIITGSVWTFFFLINHKYRREMLIIGVLIAPLVIVDYFTTPTYWSPETLWNIPVGIEGFVFTFFIAGIASVIYESIFKTKLKEKNKLIWQDVFHLIPAAAISVTLWAIFHFNVMYMIILVISLSAAVHVVFRRELLTETIISALSFALIYFAAFNLWILISPEVLNWWNFVNLSGLRLGFVPLEEILFALSFGALVGPLYEVITDSRIVKLNTPSHSSRKHR